MRFEAVRVVVGIRLSVPERVIRRFLTRGGDRDALNCAASEGPAMRGAMDLRVLGFDFASLGIGAGAIVDRRLFTLPRVVRRVFTIV